MMGFTKAKIAALKRVYGITEEQYYLLSKKQGFCCGVCKRHKDKFKTNLCVDHNHETGEIRGLLCTHCNRYVVGRHKEGTLLRNAADYLDDKYTGWIVPPKKKKRRKQKRK